MPGSDHIVAVEIDLWSDRLAAIETLRLTNFGPLFSISDSATNYDPRLITPLLLGAEISIGTYGQPMRALSNQGQIQFVLDDKAWPYFGSNYHWIGRAIRVREGTLPDGGYVEDLDLVWVGRVGDVTHDTKTATVRTVDTSIDLDVPLVSDFYPSTAPANIAGKPKQQVWGIVFCTQPALENNADQVYRASRTALASIGELRVGGIPWAPTTYPPVGPFYYEDLPGGTIQLGADPQGGDVRCDVQGAVVTSGVGDLMRQIVAPFGLGIDSAALDALDSGFPYTVGYFADSPINVLSALDDIATGTACYWGITALGLFTAGSIAAPLGSGPILLDKTTVETAALSQTIPPAWRVRVEYERHWNTEGQFFDAIDPFQRQRWSAPGLVYSREDARIKTADPRAFDVPTMRSVAVFLADAQNISQIFWNAWSVPRSVIDVTARVDPRDITLYQTIGIDYMMFQGYYRVMKAIRSIGGGATQLQLWG